MLTTDLLRVQGRFASKLAPTENKVGISKSPAWKSPTVQVIGAMAVQGAVACQCMRVSSGTRGSQLAGEALALTTDFLRVQGRFASKLAPTENKV